METLPDQPTLRDIYDHAMWWQTQGVAFDAGLRNYLPETSDERTYLIVNLNTPTAKQRSKEVGEFVYAHKQELLNLILFRADNETLKRLEFIQGLYNAGAITDSIPEKKKRRRKVVKDVAAVG